jgi:hypothetical protein
MKKLKKLRLQNIEEISTDDQKSLQGGGIWVWDPGTSGYYYCPGYIEEYSNGSYLAVQYVPVVNDPGGAFDGSVSLMEFVSVATSAILSGSAGFAVAGPAGAIAAFWSTALGGWISVSQD